MTRLTRNWGFFFFLLLLIIARNPSENGGKTMDIIIAGEQTLTTWGYD